MNRKIFNINNISNCFEELCIERREMLIFPLGIIYKRKNELYDLSKKLQNTLKKYAKQYKNSVNIDKIEEIAKKLYKSLIFKYSICNKNNTNKKPEFDLFMSKNQFAKLEKSNMQNLSKDINNKNKFEDFKARFKIDFENKYNVQRKKHGQVFKHLFEKAILEDISQNISDLKMFEREINFGGSAKKFPKILSNAFFYGVAQKNINSTKIILNTNIDIRVKISNFLDELSNINLRLNTSINILDFLYASEKDLFLQNDRKLQQKSV